MEMKNMLFYEFGRMAVGPLLDWHYHINSEGADNVPEDGAALIVSNHRSLMDPPVIGLSIDRFVNFAAASYSFKMPLVKQIYSAAGAFPLSEFA